MWTKAAPLRQLRAELRPRLPERAFLKRDRGDALLITNAPAFDPGLTALPGFRTLRRGALMKIYPAPETLLRFERRFRAPPDFFSESLKRFAGAAPTQAALTLFTAGAKLLDLGAAAPPGAADAYARSVREAAARALREGDGGGLYACALLKYLIEGDETDEA